MTRVTAPAQLMYGYIEDSQSEVRKDYSEKFIEKYNYGERDKAMSYLDRSDIDIDINYDQGAPLIQAAREGDVELVEKLFERGATVGLTKALEWAAYNGHISCMELLIKHGADPNGLKGTSAYTNHRLTREFFAKQALVKTRESTANALANHSDIHLAAGSPTRNDNSVPLIGQPSEPQILPTTPSSTREEIHKSAHSLVAVNGAHHSKSGTFTNPALESIVYQKESLAEFSKTIIAEIRKIAEKLDLSAEECIKLRDLGCTLVELNGIKTDNFIFTRNYLGKTGRLITHFHIIPEAIGEAAVDKGYFILPNKLHYVEEKILERAVAVLNFGLSVQDDAAGENDVAKVVVADVFARKKGTLEGGKKVNLPPLYSLALWKKSESELVLIDPTTSKFSQHIAKFLNLRLGSSIEIRLKTGSSYLSDEVRRASSSAVEIALTIDEQLKEGEDINLDTILNTAVSNVTVPFPGQSIEEHGTVKSIEDSNHFINFVYKKHKEYEEYEEYFL